MNVLFITTEWPSNKRPFDAPFLVEYAQGLEKCGINVDVFHFQGNQNPLNYFIAWLAIRRSPAWQQADILHAHWGQSALLGLFSKKPLVVTFHGSDLQGIVKQDGSYSLWGKLLVTISKWIAKRADQVIVVSEKLKSYLPAGIGSVTVIPMGVDLSCFKQLDQTACRRRLGLDLEKLYILFASDPRRPEKRYNLATEAVKMLIASDPVNQIELLVVNNQPHHKMPEYLNACNVLLLTSSHEGSPVVIKEALACNLPIVSVDVGDIKERLQGIEGCYLCPDDRVETIMHQLSQAIASPNHINGFPALQNLGWEVISQQTISIYQKCLK